MALRAVDDHPKLARLKSILHCGRGVALGYLEALWHFAGRYTPQGDIGKYSDAEIEAWIEWAGEPGELIKAITTACWLDRSKTHRLLIHDWHEHADDATRLALKRKRLDFLTRCPDSVPTLSGLPGPGPGPGPGPDKTTAACAAIELRSMDCKEPPVFQTSSSTEKENGNGFYSTQSKIVAEFESEFWPNVWLKVGKDAALKAYRSARKRATCDEIKRGAISLGPLIMRQAAAQHRTPVGPGPWLNAGRWSDAPEVYLTGLDRNGKPTPQESKAEQDREFYNIMKRKGVI